VKLRLKSRGGGAGVPSSADAACAWVAAVPVAAVPLHQGLRAGRAGYVYWLPPNGGGNRPLDDDESRGAMAAHSRAAHTRSRKGAPV